MKMYFYVADKKQLEQLKTGDRVRFIIESNAGALQIVNIQKAN
jgi:Cu/Ag efflux protein CusF